MTHMSFELKIVNDLVHLRYSGHVDALEVIRLVKDSDFIPLLGRYKKMIYDFSNATSFDLHFDEVKQFSIIANVEANFIDSVHIVIVLKRPSGREIAEHYRDEITAPGWHVDIVESLDEAMTLLSQS